MKILVATSDVPFVEGGHRVIARALQHALQEAGHSAEIFFTPQNRFGRQFSAYLATRLLDVGVCGLGEKIDRLISLRFPSYALKHPNHVCWLNHRMREYYDLWPAFRSQLSWKGRIKESIRRSLIHSADAYFLKHNLRKLYAQSENVRNSLRKWGDIPSEVLYPPPPYEDYYTSAFGDFIFSPSRLTPLKRVPLLIEAIAECPSAKAVITGEGSERKAIEDLIRRHSLEDRVQLKGHVSREDLLRLYAECRAVYYAPVNEDYGLVTLEAYRSRKAVITAGDSGGPAELVENGVNGFVATPVPSQIAACFTNLLEDKPLAERMGTAGFEKYSHITWPETVRKLLG